MRFRAVTTVRTLIWLGINCLLATPSMIFAAQVPPSLVPILESKEKIAADLAAQAALCVSRRDTSHPAFKGCIDWHSAVHGVWTLIAYERATGDRRYASLVSEILAKDALLQERELLRKNSGFEMPYGRAWFLRLAIEHHSHTGSNDLFEIADEVAQSLQNYFHRVGVNPMSSSYDSASWALINLLDYAKYRDLKQVRWEVEQWVNRHFIAGDQKCSRRGEVGEFMAICTNWAAVVARVLERDDYRKWLDNFVAVNGIPSPITPAQPHSYGLNFSRAWGLWDMYDKSGRLDIVDTYSAHFDRGLNPKSNWQGDYQTVGHWVAQFGMFALQPLFGSKAGR